MRCRILRATVSAEAEKAIEEAANILRRGGLVAFPTETVYGLGADARRREAVRRVFAAKGRPGDNPLIVHTADAASALALGRDVADVARELANAFWPGPLSLVLPLGDPSIVPEVTGGLDTIAVRVPDHPVALALLRRFGGPVAAPSANVSGRPSPTDAHHVWEDLGERIDAILDGGPSGVGVESTVVDVSSGSVRILRLGGVTVEALEDVAGSVEVARHVEDGSDGRVLSPGMKYKHYAPTAPLRLVQGTRDDVVRAMAALRDRAKLQGTRPAFFLSRESADALGMNPDDEGVYVYGAFGDDEALAHGLYAGVRALDRSGPSVIYVEASYGSGGLGRTIADRLHRAAEGEALWAHDLLRDGVASPRGANGE